MIHLTDTDADQEYEFPESTAEDLNPNDLFWMNGHNIYYLDYLNQPQSIFIGEKLWDNALEEFENQVEHSVIIRHNPACQTYDF